MIVTIENKKQVLRVLILIMLLGALCCYFVTMGCRRHEPSDATKKILGVSNAKIRELGYDLRNMTTEYDTDNKQWKKYTESLSDGDMDSTMALLHERDFQGVYYAPKGKSTLGGDVWVFVDRDTNEVITVLRFK
jgi:hypothetical protein